MPPRRAPSVVLLVVLLLLAASACSGSADDGERPGDTVRFASYDFSENEILAAVYAESARQAGLPVSLHPGAGTREVVEPALEQGVVDVVVDYLGTAVRFVDPSGAAGTSTPEQLHATLSALLAPRGVTVLAAAAAEDQNGFAVSRAFATEHGVSRLSELEPLAPGLAFGGPPECPERPLCLPGLREVYGLRFGSVVNMPSRAATVEALVAGSIQVGLLETTDARLGGGGAPVVLLADDRALQPHENVVPLVRTAALERWGDRLADALDAVSARLTTADLSGLNRAVEVEGLTPRAAAARWWDGS
ncbi:putative glycine betaine/choline-binding (Lipo) protein of an ABC-type transport system (Osmoprotectant binding protein) [Modestobacter italicus]|uniref:Glycine betaine/choline-binding (Lipo) protein of an ABC-type transport system (Osmoprotectant binding protein) n=1 Tax=Modestobacter italicus (strain DSM 44449 / CECT 9708 / BC 501) TaxID=2732864 RepID=I4EWH2_MODI5|nr:ABC transporter substrate-binding protein [Modestobacter marinus]CCH87735.1 putative glycine betaine/choline-binding (Lipo) protein of an ABC-type transport system (Osmoprotectant binding protein) [Modestobacter marinus]